MPSTDSPARSWRGLIIVVSALLVFGVISTFINPRPDTPAQATPAVTHEIGFQIQGAGRADFAGVWTSAQVIRHVPSTSSTQYVDPMAAVLTVRSTDARATNEVRCRILVDGVVMDEQIAVYGASATCVWVDGTVGLPVVVNP